MEGVCKIFFWDVMPGVKSVKLVYIVFHIFKDKIYDLMNWPVQLEEYPGLLTPLTWLVSCPQPFASRVWSVFDLVGTSQDSSMW